jgi:hypothetical protein
MPFGNGTRDRKMKEKGKLEERERLDLYKLLQIEAETEM